MSRFDSLAYASFCVIFIVNKMVKTTLEEHMNQLVKKYISRIVTHVFKSFLYYDLSFCYTIIYLNRSITLKTFKQLLVHFLIFVQRTCIITLSPSHIKIPYTLYFSTKKKIFKTH